MPYLDTLLAYSVTMLVVATAVTQLVRFAQKMMGKRREFFVEFMHEYLSKEVQPVLEREFMRLKKHAAEGVTDAMMVELGTRNMSDMLDRETLEKAVTLSTDELLEQMKRSEYGKKMLADLGNEAEAVFAELGRRFEYVGDIFTRSFRTHTRHWATGIALVLAVIFNIDSVHILRTYHADTARRSAATGRIEAVLADYVQGAQKNQEAAQVRALDEVKKDVKDLSITLENLKAQGFPIGYSNFPYGGESITQAMDSASSRFWRWVVWVAGILITAVMAGMGAPFWYDAVLGIRNIATQARGGK